MLRIHSQKGHFLLVADHHVGGEADGEQVVIMQCENSSELKHPGGITEGVLLKLTPEVLKSRH